MEKKALTQSQAQGYQIRMATIQHYKSLVQTLLNEMNSYIMLCAKEVGIDPTNATENWHFDEKELCFVEKPKEKAEKPNLKAIPKPNKKEQPTPRGK